MHGGKKQGLDITMNDISKKNSKNLIVRGARVIDPQNGVDKIADVYVSDGVFVDKFSGSAEEIDARGLVLAPGFIDAHVHLREPGQTRKETVRTGTMAAAAGGFTSVVAMPNTSPAMDNAASVKLLKEIVASDAFVRVYPTGCITVGREGKALAPIGSLKNAGVIAITDDGSCVQNNELMKRALEYANMFSLIVMDHCQDASLTAKGQIREGKYSLLTGLKGWPNAGEDIIVARNVILSKYTGARIHLQHISSALSLEIIRGAKKRGIKVSAEATPHHLALSDKYAIGYDTNFKMNPPLGSEDDRLALIEAVKDGTIDVIATDHAPHSITDKDKEFDYAAFGITGLETAFAVCNEVLVCGGHITLNKLIELMTSAPAKLFGLKAGALSEGYAADFVLLDPEKSFVFDKTYSRSTNTPWLGKTLKGKVEATYVGGVRAYPFA